MRIANFSSFKNSHLIGLMGQSNANGYQTPADTNSYNAKDGQYIFDNPSLTWQALQQNVNNGGAPYTYTGSIGIEMDLMQLLKNHYGSDQYLYKYAQGGTSLSPSLNPGVIFDWQPYTTETYMFNGAVANYLSAIASFPAQIQKMKVLIWMQGENDTTLTDANNYQANFIKFFNALKIGLGLPNLLCLQTGLSNSQTAYDPTGRAIINSAKMNLAINGNKYVNTDGAEVGADNVHFTAFGQNDIATRVFNTLITML